MANLNDIISGVYARVGSANITGMAYSELQNLATDSLTTIQNSLGTTLDSTNFETKYLPPAKDLTTLYVIGNLFNTNIDTDVRVGNIQLSYSSDVRAHEALLTFYANRAEKSLRDGLGIRIAHTYTQKMP